MDFAFLKVLCADIQKSGILVKAGLFFIFYFLTFDTENNFLSDFKKLKYLIFFSLFKTLLSIKNLKFYLKLEKKMTNTM